MELRPLQKAGQRFIEARDKSFLCLRMRLGKTATALQIAERGKVTIVVCPVSVLYHWEREVKLWRPDLKPQVVRNMKTEWDTSRDVFIMPYSMVAKFAEARKLHRPHMLVIDESHYCKSGKAKRTRVICTLVKAAQRVVALTGTPIPNRPIELYPLLNAMGAPFARTKKAYGLAYCDAHPSPWHPGLDFTGASNLDELRDNLGEWMFYSTGGYVPPVPTLFEVDAQIGQAERAAIQKIDWANPDIPFELMSEIRRWSGEGKIEAAVDHVKDCLEEMDKVVVFAWHQAVVEELAIALAEYHPVTLYGGATSTSREAAVSRFQMDPSTRVFIGNIQAAGEGISLAAANHAVFVEQAWTPGAMDQAGARIETADPDRIVSLDYLVRRGGIDEKLMRAIMEKRAIVSEALNDRSDIGDF